MNYWLMLASKHFYRKFSTTILIRCIETFDFCDTHPNHDICTERNNERINKLNQLNTKSITLSTVQISSLCTTFLRIIRVVCLPYFSYWLLRAVSRTAVVILQPARWQSSYLELVLPVQMNSPHVVIQVNSNLLSFHLKEIQTRSLAFSRNSFVILRNILDQNQEREYQCLEKSGKSSREQLWLSFRSNFPPSGANSDSIFRLMYSLGL